ncbi:MAG: M55 family metallopeptidase [Clostridia bacterium]
MKIAIMTDLEGISGVDDIIQIDDEDGAGYRSACECLMADTNAAVAGAFDGGATEVYVMDGHGGATNFIKELLDPRATQISIAKWCEMTAAREFDAFMEIGAHAKPNTMNAFLDHVQSSRMWFEYFINGVPSGELAQGAVFMGHFDVPFVMVTGDAAAIDEAHELLGSDIATAVVKTARCRNHAELIDFDTAVARVRAAARDGMALIGKIAPYKIPLPLTIELTFCRTDFCDDTMVRRPDVTRVDARRVRRVVDKIEGYSDLLFW